MARPFIDFGPAAADYAEHRPGFPASFFERAATYGVGRAGQRVLDLGTGTGTLARGFVQRGCWAVGLDPSPEMLAAAVALDRAAGVSVAYLRAWSHAIGVVAAAFDVVCAGQCWHWFDRQRAAAEADRVLRPGGIILIAYFTYLSPPGSVAHASEEIVLRHNPTWPLAGSDGRVPQFAADLAAQGFAAVETFEFDTDAVFTHAAWRGRMRACNGVLTMAPSQAAAFDEELARFLAAHHPGPLRVPHRIFAIVGRKPG